MRKIIALTLLAVIACGSAHARTGSLAPNMSGSLSPSTAKQADNMTVDGVKLSSVYDYVYYGPKLYHDYTQRYIPTWQTFTRASGGTYIDVTGVMQTATTNEARYTHDPVTLAPGGLLYEEQRTNSVPNNSMVGAVAGTPGTLPTGWAVSASQGGITKEIVGTGTEYGMPYIDLHYSGTASNTTDNVIYFRTDISAIQSDVWTVSFYHRLVGGSLSNVVYTRVGMDEATSGGSWLTGGSGTFTTSSVLARASLTRTLTNASTGRLQPDFKILAANGQAINVTIRLYVPQAEKLTDTSKLSPSSVILTTSGAATRFADIATFVVPSGVTSLRYVFNDDTYQDIAVTYGSYTIPTALNTYRIKRVIGK